MSKSVAEHINALHAAREAFIKCEADKVLKQALKSRIYTQGQDISVGDWIYFKKLRKWEGPVKITTRDGNLLYAVRNGRLLTINSDHATLARFEGEFIDNPNLAVSGEDVPEQTVNNEVPQLETGQQIVSRENVEQAVEDNVAGQHAQEDDEALEVYSNDNNSENDQVNNDVISREVLEEGEHHDQEELSPRPTPSKIDKSKLREKDVIRFRKSNEEGWKKGVLYKRAGKVGRQYENYWNIQNLETGHIAVENANDFVEIERVPKEPVETIEEELTCS